MSLQETESTTVILKIVGKNFKVKCPKSMHSELQDAASYLNDKMLVAQQKDKFSSMDHLAIVAALNISHELLLARKKQQCSDDYDICHTKLENLAQKISDALEIE